MKHRGTHQPFLRDRERANTQFRRGRLTDDVPRRRPAGQADLHEYAHVARSAAAAVLDRALTAGLERHASRTAPTGSTATLGAQQRGRRAAGVRWNLFGRPAGGGVSGQGGDRQHYTPTWTREFHLHHAQVKETRALRPRQSARSRMTQRVSSHRRRGGVRRTTRPGAALHQHVLRAERRRHRRPQLVGAVDDPSRCGRTSGSGTATGPGVAGPAAGEKRWPAATCATPRRPAALQTQYSSGWCPGCARRTRGRGRRGADVPGATLGMHPHS